MQYICSQIADIEFEIADGFDLENDVGRECLTPEQNHNWTCHMLHHNTLKEAVFHAFKKQLDAVFLCQNGDQYLVSGKRRRFIRRPLTTETTLPDPLLKTTRKAADTIPDFGTSLTESGRNLNELIWTLCYQSHPGTLTGDRTKIDVVTLVRWPNFTRIPHKPSYIRIASLIFNRPTTINQIHRILKIDEEDVLHFYNCADESGHLKSSEVYSRETENSPPEHRQQSIISALLSRLSSR